MALGVAHAGPRYAVIVRNRLRVATRIALFGHIGLFDSYFDGDIDIEGDLGAALAEGIREDRDRPRPLVRLRNLWHEWRHNNASWQRAKDNARFHYGLGTGFYKL